MSPTRIVVVRRRRREEHEHHGGSWKVAYADFVTAMMAFFLVMWIMNMDQGVRDLVQGYFENPIGFKRSYSGGSHVLSQGNSITNLEIRRQLILKRREAEEARFREVAAGIERRLEAMAAADPNRFAVEIVVGDDGLRIEMMEPSEGAAFFELASARPTEELSRVLRIVARELRGLPNGIIVEGHTDAAPFGGTGYSNWELSVDRANAARRVLLGGGVAPERLAGIRGYADRELKFIEDPLDRRNRRVTVFLPFETPRPGDLEPLSWPQVPGPGLPAGLGDGAAM